jgi:hypothetical protein
LNNLKSNKTKEAVEKYIEALKKVEPKFDQARKDFNKPNWAVSVLDKFDKENNKKG